MDFADFLDLSEEQFFAWEENDLDDVKLVSFKANYEWVEVTIDPPTPRPGGGTTNPPTRLFKCFVDFVVEAEWKKGELALAMVSLDKGPPADRRTSYSFIGDFNKLKSLEGGLIGYHKGVGDSYSSDLRNGGVVNFMIEVVTQTSRGYSELQRREGGGVLDRVRRSTQFRRNLIIKAPPRPSTLRFPTEQGGQT